jgi:hypothetical protein
MYTMCPIKKKYRWKVPHFPATGLSRLQSSPVTSRERERTPQTQKVGFSSISLCCVCVYVYVVCAQFSTFKNVSKHKEAFPCRHMQRTSSWWASSLFQFFFFSSYRARWIRTVRGKIGIACLWLNPPSHRLYPSPPYSLPISNEPKS